MRCPSCGEERADLTRSCPACGEDPDVGLESLRRMGLRLCPRCAYRGEGVPYFNRPIHVGLLVGLALITYGIGGLVYWLVKRDARICPSCGVEWRVGAGGYAAALPTGNGAGIEARNRTGHRSGSVGSPLRTDVPPLPPDGGVRRVAGIGLIGFAGGTTVLGFMAGAPAYDPWLLGPAALAGGGALILWWGRAARNNRRRALHRHLEQRILALAREREGSLTASEAATALGISLPATERVLLSMEDGLRVRSDVTDEGILLFEFPEFQARELPPGEA